MKEIEKLEKVHSFLKGVNRFYENFEKRNIANRIYWQEGSTQILDYSEDYNPNLPTLLFIPSLINRSYILDLDEQMSMVKHFSSLKYRVLLVDFNEPLEEEASFGIVEYHLRLTRAAKEISKTSAIISIGYCLGGLFSCLLTTNPSLNITSQVLLATPFDFAHFNRLLSNDGKEIIEVLKTLVKGMNKIPPNLLQWFFSSLDLAKIWDKFSEFSKAECEADIDRFLKIERWVNDGISITRQFALEALNIIMTNQLPCAIWSTVPSLVISGKNDLIVPPSSANQIILTLRDNHIHQFYTGHLGLVVGKKAQQEIWPLIATWIGARCKNTSK